MVFDIDIPDEDPLSDKKYGNPGIPNPVLLLHGRERYLVCYIMIDLQHPDIKIRIFCAEFCKHWFDTITMNAPITIKEIAGDLCAGDMCRRRMCRITART